MKHESKVEVMVGPALCLAASQYPRLVQVIAEGVQNGLDAGARVIQILINRKKREIFIRDNGAGATFAKFEQALTSVCQTLKKRDKLGQFGIGLIAPLDKCHHFTFTTLSREQGNKRVLRWHFDCDQIKQMRNVSVPYQQCAPDVLFGKKGESHGVTAWSSEVRIVKYTKDGQIGKLDVNELRQQILASFAVAMRERKATVWIDEIDEAGMQKPPVQIRASDFGGKALQEERIRAENGTTVIRIFVVPRSGKRKGEILMGVLDNPFRVPFKVIANQLEALNFVGKDVIDAFLSGVFEGEILHSGIILAANRKTFVENDALLDLGVQLEAWYVKTGREHMKRAQDNRKDERLQDLGRRSLANLKKLFDANPEFCAVLRTAELGRVTDDHTKRSRKQVAGEEELTTVSAVGDSRSGSGAGGHMNSVPKCALPEHTPYTVTGPKGRQRTLVHGDSQGLNFCHMEMESNELWRFDRTCGTLYFNITHPQWVECDRNDRDIMRLQEIVATHAITVELMPEAERMYLKPFLQNLIPPTVYILGKSLAFTQGFGPKK